MDALVFAFSGLSLTKSRKDVNDDLVDVGDCDLKRVVHLLRSRGGIRRTEVAAAPISVDDLIPDAPDPVILAFRKEREDDDPDVRSTKRLRFARPRPHPRPRAQIRHTRADPSESVPIGVLPFVPIAVAIPAPTLGPVTVTITEVVVAVCPVLNPAQQELRAWNVRCVKAKSEESPHAPRCGPVKIIEGLTPGERRALNAWNFKCNQARGPRAPHAPRRGPVIVTITEAVVNLRRVLTAGEQRELDDWNARCLAARSDFCPRLNTDYTMLDWVRRARFGFCDLC
ncbi:hypothetical protein MSAN_01880700 [Mycena sanguinolenta]|uniref:Uncharacterized protein n=1 Tax=Mycena sanguinolenta TaxID=230812 RepID=A0A8H7CSI8_9AGAR|nr:hypothetical protein MSAN_01880700 [Mycena sanguinolenta]